MLSMIPFFKFHGTGNDFVVFSKPELPANGFTPEQIRLLTHRRFGIGADGVIVIQAALNADFEMLYYNADGNLGSLCGNGSRCAVVAAQKFGLFPETKQDILFLAYDGHHTAQMNNQNQVSISLNPPKFLKQINETDFETDTGSPHYIRFISQPIDEQAVLKYGKEIRYNEIYRQQGINVNFVQILNDNELFVWTYERGVEAVTLSCGTGAMAAAAAFRTLKPANKTTIHTLGGALIAITNFQRAQFTLQGPVVLVYEGKISLNSTTC